MAARETFVDSNMSALYAASDPMESHLASDSNRTKQHNYKPYQNPTQMPQNTSLFQSIPNQPSFLPQWKTDIRSTPIFRSYNNNMLWFNNGNPKATHNSSFITPNYQWKAARDLTQLSPPENHSIILSLTAQPLLDRPLISQERQTLEKLDPTIFNPISIVDIKRFSHYTLNHPNKALITYLINGLESGFMLGYTEECKRSIMKNLTSLELSPDTLPTFIRNELSVGRISGPFSLKHLPVDLFMVNPFGLVEKRETNPTEYRVITHHSAPYGSSVNDGIDRHEFKISFDTLKHAARWIRHFGPGSLLSKIDIKEAYRILPVHLIDQLLQGIICDNKLYFNKALAFNSQSSCGIFCRFADIVV